MHIHHRLSYVLVDVFTSRPYLGNQLAVFTDAGRLRSDQMQRIAKEMNLSETTFVTARPPDIETRDGIAVRIFTVDEELPFAGHPTLGTAYVLHRLGRATRRVTLDLRVGRIPVELRTEDDGSIFGEMRQVEPIFGQIHDRREIAAATGLAVDDLAAEPPIQTVSTGNAFLLVPLRSLAAMEHLRVDLARVAAYLERTDAKFFYFVAQGSVDGTAQVHARMQFYGGEDPATGSAAGPCAAWMVRYGWAEPDTTVIIEQGVEIGRPSRLFVRASRRDGTVTDVRVGGNVVEVGRGEIEPPAAER